MFESLSDFFVSFDGAAPRIHILVHHIAHLCLEVEDIVIVNFGRLCVVEIFVTRKFIPILLSFGQDLVLNAIAVIT